MYDSIRHYRVTKTYAFNFTMLPTIRVEYPAEIEIPSNLRGNIVFLPLNLQAHINIATKRNIAREIFFD